MGASIPQVVLHRVKNPFRIRPELYLPGDEKTPGFSTVTHVNIAPLSDSYDKEYLSHLPRPSTP